MVFFYIILVRVMPAADLSEGLKKIPIMFFLSFAAKQPLVYLNLEFGDKYNDVVLALWELGTIFIFDPFLIKFLLVHQNSIGSTP